MALPSGTCSPVRSSSGVFLLSVPSPQVVSIVRYVLVTNLGTLTTRVPDINARKRCLRVTEVDRLQTSVGPGGVWWRGDAVRSFGAHLVAGHCAL